MKITYVQAPGFLYDLFYIFVCRFNEEIRIEAESTASSAEEAAALVNAIKPKFAVPMHYGDIVGTAGEGARFCSLLDDGIIGMEKMS